MSHFEGVEEEDDCYGIFARCENCGSKDMYFIPKEVTVKAFNEPCNDCGVRGTLVLVENLKVKEERERNKFMAEVERDAEFTLS